MALRNRGSAVHMAPRSEKLRLGMVGVSFRMPTVNEKQQNNTSLGAENKTSRKKDNIRGTSTCLGQSSFAIFECLGVSFYWYKYILLYKSSNLGCLMILEG